MKESVYFREGKIKEVAEYCETDVVATYQLWLRYEPFRGALSQDAFEASQRNLADFMSWGAVMPIHSTWRPRYRGLRRCLRSVLLNTW
jgi:hypothetical protein